MLRYVFESAGMEGLEVILLWSCQWVIRVVGGGLDLLKPTGVTVGMRKRKLIAIAVALRTVFHSD